MDALFLLYAILAYSFVVGFPIARWLLGPTHSTEHGPQLSLRVFYLAPIIGFTLLDSVVYGVSQVLSVGSDPIARPSALVLLLGALAASVWLFARQRTSPSIWAGVWFIPLVIGAPLAAFNILYPIVIGHWEYAYSTGNDGARYLMMVTYLRSAPWEWFHVIVDPTYYRLIAHTLDHQAGATVASLF